MTFAYVFLIVLKIGGSLSIIPIHFDWREQTKISPVKNMEDCNACWAFSAIANIESHLSIYKDTEVTLSEQFLIDCDRKQNGCNNGSITTTFSDIVLNLHGGALLRDYPFEGYQSECRKPPSLVKITGFKNVVGDEDKMANALYHHGPLSAAINSKTMKSTYVPRTIDEPSDEQCDPKYLDHAVLIVGYDVYVDEDREVPYWIIKNSWGTDWGDQGYYYLVRGRNACGIASDVSFSIVE